MSDQKVNLGQPAATQGAQPGELGYVPPSETVPLPSMGLVYPPGDPLHGREVVEIRSMTARDEDILTSRALLKQGKAISVLLKSCLTDKSIDVEQMLVGDRNAVLIAIRITGYGADYSVDFNCPSCDEKVKHKFDLAKLPIKHLEEPVKTPGLNSFEFMLPVSKKVAVFRLLTGADQRELTTTLEKSRKIAGAGAPENAVTTTLLHSCISIGGETDRGKLARIIQNLPAMDAKKLRTHIDEISPGVEMVQDFTCHHCGTESEVDVPMGTEFFWPSD